MLSNANHCTVRGVEEKVAFEFLSELPFALREGAKRRFVGLYHGEELIVLLAAQTPDDSANAQWELCGVYHHEKKLLVGAAGKLFSWFLTTYTPECFIAYCQSPFCSFNLCLSLGFVKDDSKSGKVYIWTSKIDGIIYKITNNINGKTYIGLSKTNDDRRWREHISDSKFPIDKAIKKYGKENFTYEVIDTATTCYELAAKEREWIEQVKPDYNIRPGGYLLYRAHRSEESRARMREAAKHRPPVSEETRRKMSVARKGRRLSPEHAAKLRQSNIGRPMSEKCRQRLYEANHGPEATERRRRAATGIKKTPETIEKLRKSNIGKHYYNNGIITVKRYECPEGFVPGILKKHKD